MRLNVCVNEIALFGPCAAIVKSKTFFDSDGSKEVCPRDEIVDPPGTTVLPIDRHVLLKVSFYFVHCVMCNRCW